MKYVVSSFLFRLFLKTFQGGNDGAYKKHTVWRHYSSYKELLQEGKKDTWVLTLVAGVMMETGVISSQKNR